MDLGQGAGRGYAKRMESARRGWAGWADRVVRAGLVVYATGIGALGLLDFVNAGGVFGMERILVDYVSGIVLVAAAVSIFIGVGQRATAVALAVMLSVWVVALHAPAIVREPRDAAAWIGAGETLALAGVAWLLAGAAVWGRACFGLAVLVLAGALMLVAHGSVPSVPHLDMRTQWSSLCVIVAMVGGSWVVAGSFSAAGQAPRSYRAPLRH
jgi:hypothetical protein